MASTKPLFEVELAGFPLKLRSCHDRETVAKLVQLVNQKVGALMGPSSSISYQKALLLACLHIAEDLVLLRRSTLTELNHIESRTEDLVLELETMTSMSQT